MAEASGKALSAFGKLATIAVIAVMFALGLVGTVYLSLRSPEIQVPDVVSKSYTDGTAVLAKAGLDISERAQRYKPDVQPGMILDQTPHAGEVVKSGQTIRVVVSRGPREGEQVAAADAPDEKKGEGANESKNDNAGKSSDSSNKNENQNRERRNKNANKNTNSNANSNANNRNAGNANGANNNAAQRNTNSNLNRNANRGLVINGNNAAANANRNRNANSRNANANSGRTNSNANRRPNF